MCKWIVDESCDPAEVHPMWADPIGVGMT
jgi:hypothetical protein